MGDSIINQTKIKQNSNKKGDKMRLTKEEKQLLNWVVSKVTDNVLNGENSKDLSSDESLIFSFDYEDLKALVDIQVKLAKEV